MHCLILLIGIEIEFKLGLWASLLASSSIDGIKLRLIILIYV